MTPAVTPEIKRELAHTGTLRVGINLSNFLLVTGKTANGDPVGVAPDLGAEIAARLGVPVRYVPFATPGELADKAGADIWDIGLIGAEPQRAAKIAFSPAYCEIEATYLVPAGSPIKTIADVDKPGVKIAVTARTAYGLWLERNIKHATRIETTSLDNAADKFLADKLDALAGLKSKLLTDLAKVPGGKILDGNFTTVQQAIGTARSNSAGAAYLAAFAEDAKTSGLVAKLIAKHKVIGLSVPEKA
jgi:polar amino acid transport system substrate-binding protein